MKEGRKADFSSSIPVLITSPSFFSSNYIYQAMEDTNYYFSVSNGGGGRGGGGRSAGSFGRIFVKMWKKGK